MDSHQIAPAGHQTKRDERERQTETEHSLAEHERLQRIETPGDNDYGGDHGGQPPPEKNYSQLEESLQDHLSSHGANAGGRKAGGQQGHAEEDCRVFAEEWNQSGVSSFDGIARHGVAKKYGGRHDEHR